jgi:hypothetical protein
MGLRDRARGLEEQERGMNKVNREVMSVIDRCVLALVDPQGIRAD